VGEITYKDQRDEIEIRKIFLVGRNQLTQIQRYEIEFVKYILCFQQLTQYTQLTEYTQSTQSTQLTQYTQSPYITLRH